MTPMEIRERMFREVYEHPENFDMIAGNLGKALLHKDCEWPDGLSPESQGLFIRSCLIELERRHHWATRQHQYCGNAICNFCSP